MREFARNHVFTLIYFGVILIAFGVLFHSQQKIRDAQVSGCERGNVIRSQLNVVGSTLTSFLLIAVQAREQSAALEQKNGETAKAQDDRDTARQYRALVLSLTKFPLTDCTRI